MVAASDTLGVKQTGKAKAVLIVDSRADKAQREALIRLAKKEGGKLVENVVAVRTAKVNLEFCPCDEGGCAKLHAGEAKIETRCLSAKHDKVCGNESAFYPPLARDVTARPAAHPPRRRGPADRPRPRGPGRRDHDHRRPRRRRIRQQRALGA